MNKRKREDITEGIGSELNHETFKNSTIAFENLCSQMEHNHCENCNIVSMQNIFKSSSECKNCANITMTKHRSVEGVPLWEDELKVPQYHVPNELKCLREGEKLLIQQISMYVPLHHLMYGQLGARGHIVSFPQDLSDICRELPRLPSNVSLIRVVKHFKLSDGELSSKSFSIRKIEVLNALKWLKQYNVLYHDIQICEENLNWIKDGVEQQLQPSIFQETQLNETLDLNAEDRGPAEGQVAAVVDANTEIEPCYGTIAQFNAHTPKEKDGAVIEDIRKAVECGTKKNGGEKRPTIDFPYVSPEPICEYTERSLFERAFPCLFPGGIGGYSHQSNSKLSLADWIEKTMLYKDCRFARDKMWAFCALNYLARHINQSSGGFFVQSFFKNGPQSLSELQKQLNDGNYSWLNSIAYFSFRVTGSSAYWRTRRSEVFAWINYHLEQKHGPPSFFITLSCAEYHWKDIERLIEDCYKKAGLNPPDFTKGRAALINEHTIVVQEYFHQRVNAWLETVGKDLLQIKHHWHRFEFSPSRGQIHVHMLAICDNLDMMETCYNLQDEPEKLALYLSKWSQDTLGMTATLDEASAADLTGVPHPSTVNYEDLLPSEVCQDIANCQIRFQTHKCHGFCMRKRNYPNQNESPESKRRRVCRCGAGVEAHPDKCDTPGFPLLNEPRVVKDL